MGIARRLTRFTNQEESGTSSHAFTFIAGRSEAARPM
jgi:hypothetical protein